MSKKTDWANFDKRIRDRFADDPAAVQAALDKLPDLSDVVETIDVEQPALVREEPDSACAGDLDSTLN
jgi:hypothetical protein